jgi:hydrogenase nickel incorporation protein HypA/HybF
MHEMAIVSELLEEVLRVAESHQASHIQQVEVRVGALRQVVPEALRLGFEAASRGTLAEGAELKIAEEKIVAVCKACGCMFMPRPDDFVCPQCHQSEPRIVAGNDILLRSMTCETQEVGSA